MDRREVEVSTVGLPHFRTGIRLRKPASLDVGVVLSIAGARQLVEDLRRVLDNVDEDGDGD